MDLTTAKACWQKVLDVFSNDPSISKLIFNQYYNPIKVYYIDNQYLILDAGGDFNATYVSKKSSEAIYLQCCDKFGINFKDVKVLGTNGCKEFSRTLKNTQLNPKFTFNSFVTGQSNLMAYTAALAVADNPGEMYNPLFLWGGSGLGKTHLMTAIANAMLQKDPGTNVQFYSYEQFTNLVVESIREKTQTEMHSTLRSADILFVDDIQLLAGRTATQEEFFNTFNELHARGKQIVISADKPPESIPTLEDRMRGRFKSGIVMKIDKPDFETRCAILKNKAEECGFKVENDAIDLIAERIDTNIRELEGCLKTCDFLARTISSGVVTKAIVEQQLGSAITAPAATAALTPEILMELVSKHTSVSVDDIRSNSRGASIMRARHMSIYLVSEYINSSPSELGRIFGRDHSTIVNSIKASRKLINDPNSGFLDIVNAIKNEANVEKGK